MSGLRGLVLGVAGLTLAEAVVSNRTATHNAGAIVTLVSNGLARWLNPYTPLIPDLTAGKATTGHLSGGLTQGDLHPINPPAGGGTPARPAVTQLPPGAGVGGNGQPV